MNPQSRLNDLFLDDLLIKMKAPDCDAVECFTRLRLYIAASGYEKTLRELLREKGVTPKRYDALLSAYNAQLAHKT